MPGSSRIPDVTKDIRCEFGRWRAGALHTVPRGTVQWNGMPRRSYVASVGPRAPLAVIRRALYEPTWIVDMPGFLWDVRGRRGSPTSNALKTAEAPVRVSHVEGSEACGRSRVCGVDEPGASVARRAASSMCGQLPPAWRADRSGCPPTSSPQVAWLRGQRPSQVRYTLRYTIAGRQDGP